MIGELAPRGVNHWGVFSSMKPLVFLRPLYCVDTRLRPLRGHPAATRGCPTTVAGSRRFRAVNPALFTPSGFADHMWMRWYPPNRDPTPDPDFTELPAVGKLERVLHRIQALYGSRTRFPIYNTEFGYITKPPNYSDAFVSATTAAYYLNWAEYLSWRDTRIVTISQYLLRDPVSSATRYTGWSSGLLTLDGQEKVTYNAWRLPLYLPVQTARRGHRLEVWGCIRPAYFALVDGGSPQIAQLQFRRASGTQWTTIEPITISSTGSCYFDVRVAPPASGSFRLTYSYPPRDRLLPESRTAVSRSVEVTVR